MELCSVLYISLDGRGVGGRTDTHICMAESLRCSLETVTTLFISYTPIQKTNKQKIIKFAGKKDSVLPMQGTWV